MISGSIVEVTVGLDYNNKMSRATCSQIALETGFFLFVFVPFSRRHHFIGSLGEQAPSYWVVLEGVGCFLLFLTKTKQPGVSLSRPSIPRELVVLIKLYFLLEPTKTYKEFVMAIHLVIGGFGEPQRNFWFQSNFQ